MRKAYGMSLNILLLGIVSFLNDVSSEIIFPILPFFITSLGGTGIAIGIIGGMRESITSFLKVISGYISDKTGKRKCLVFSGYLLSSLFKMLLAFSRIWQHALLFLGLERIGKGVREAPRDAIIAESMPEEKGKGFGIHRTLDTTGALLGSIISLVLFWYIGFDYKTIIVIAAVVSFTSLVPMLLVEEKREEKTGVSLKVAFGKLPKKLKLFLLIAALYSLANFSYMFFMLRAKSLFNGAYEIVIPMLFYILFNFFYAGLSIPFGYLSDKVGRKQVLLGGYLLFSVTLLGFALFHSVVSYIGLFICYGIVNAIVNANHRAFVSDLSKGYLQGTGIGAYHMVVGLMALPASYIAGIIWQINPQMTFVYGASVCAFVTLLFFLVRKKL